VSPVRSRLTRALPAGAVAALVLAGVGAVALATPPSGQHPSAPVVGTLGDRANVNTDRIRLHTKEPVDVATFTVTYDPGGVSGWHTHPGLLFVVVQSGAVVREVGCDSRVYRAGDAFVESDEQPSGQVRNASVTDAAVLTATQLVPHGAPRRVEDLPPSC
jgi:quercetin dioxygenase-like cupin family protein